MFTSLNVVRMALVCLRLQQTLGDTGTQTGHRHALFGTVAQGNTVLGAEILIVGRSRSRSRTSLRRGSNGIFLGDATATAGTGDVRGSNALFVENLAGRRAGRTSRRSSSRSGRRQERRCLRCFGSGSRCSSTRLGFGVDAGDQFARNDGFAIALDDLDQHASTRRRDFQNDLVGFDIDQDFIASNGFANFLFPGSQRAFGDGLGQLGNLNFDNAHR
jgi:hypothetical protein